MGLSARDRDVLIAKHILRGSGARSAMKLGMELVNTVRQKDGERKNKYEDAPLFFLQSKLGATPPR